MNSFVVRRAVVFRFLILMVVSATALRAAAQSNSWTNPAGGNWQDTGWSLGVLPGTNQTILLTNAGWKALQISASTAQNFPESMNVDSIFISSPANSLNTLLLNQAGAATPLTVKTLTVSSNSAMVMNSSGLQINGLNGQGMEIGGQFEQNDSVVAGSQVNVGYAGPGVYDFNSGYFTVSQLWINGGNETPGAFFQNGGTNGFGITHLDGGNYVLSNGWCRAAIYFDNNGQFLQYGGVLATNLTIFGGNYLLAGGVHQGSIMVPSDNGSSSGVGAVVQTAGTNIGEVNIGTDGGGFYTLSNGVCIAPAMTVGYSGSYWQWDGTLQVNGMISLSEQQIAMGYYSVGQFYLQGGNVSSSGMSLEGYYTQQAGTNRVAGDVTLQNAESDLTLEGGLLTANNVIANAGWVGGINMTGGTMVITNSLNVGGINLPDWQGFACAGGMLVVSNIGLQPWAIFSCGNGVINQSGMLGMDNAKLYSGTNSVQFGPLELSGGNSGGTTNSALYMVAPTSVMKFGDSSGQAWADDSLLVIEGWAGSLSGGGQQQIVFGKTSTALTSAQLARIQFHNPAGLASGMYPARILATGEIVPVSGATAATPNIALSPNPHGMQLTLQCEAGRNYTIETSTDLVHWVPWTNGVNSTGTICITDTDATNCPMRFYRAKLAP